MLLKSIPEVCILSVHDNICGSQTEIMNQSFCFFFKKAGSPLFTETKGLPLSSDCFLAIFGKQCII